MRTIVYWITKQGLLCQGSGNITISNGTKISRAKYYKLLKEQKEISRNINNLIP